MSDQRPQRTPYDSPWTVKDRLKRLLWELCWALLCRPTPKPFNRWRLLVLKAFGARVEGLPFVHQRVRVEIPGNLILKDRACLGDRAVAYSLGVVEVGEGATVAQEAYLCAGSHDFEDSAMPLRTKPVKVEAGAFVGARAFVLPGVTVGRGAVVGACAVVTRNVEEGEVVAGNPARPISRKAKTEDREAG